MKNLNEEVNKIKHLFNFKKGNNLIIEQNLDGDDTVDKPTPDETDSVLDDTVSKSLPECMNYLFKKTDEKKQKEIDNGDTPYGPPTLEMDDIKIRVMIPPMTPGSEGIYLHKKGQYKPFCKFDFDQNKIL